MENKTTFTLNIDHVKRFSESNDIHKGFSFIDDDIILFDNVTDIPSAGNAKIDMFLILICRRGKLQANINNKIQIVHDNEILICKPNTIIKDCMISPDFQSQIMGISNRIIQEVFRNGINNIWNKIFYIHQNPVLRINDNTTNSSILYYDLIRLKIEQPNQLYHKEIMISLIHSILYELLSEIDNFINLPENNPVKRGEILFKNFIEILSSTKIKRQTVTFYSEKLFVTPKYLSTVCKNISGKTALEWINEFVTNEISSLLKYSDKSIKEISLELEFPNISFFGKFVKAHLGVSPKEFRKKINDKVSE